MADDEPIDPVESISPREKAEEIRKRLETEQSDNKGKPVTTLAAYEEVDGILKGIASGRITHGQPRLAEQLMRLAEELQPLLEPHHPEEVLSALGNCAEYGLTAANQPIDGPEKGKSHVADLQK